MLTPCAWLTRFVSSPGPGGGERLGGRMAPRAPSAPGRCPSSSSANSGRAPWPRPGPRRRPAAAISRVWRVGDWSLPAEQLPRHMPPARCRQPRRGPDAAGAAGRSRACGRAGARGTQGLPEPAGSGDGGRGGGDRVTERRTGGSS